MADLNALYEQYLGRAPDPSGIATWSGQDEASIIAGILGSQEYANNQAAQSSGGGGGGSPAPAPAPILDSSNPSATVAQIYQSVLGRAPDAGAQGWIDAIAAGGSPQEIAQEIANSQEGRNYAASNPNAAFNGLASISQANAPTFDNSNYSNMRYLGSSYIPVGGDSANYENQYQFMDANGGIIQVDANGKPINYTPSQSWYQQQYAAHPDAIRTGYGGQQYLATGPLDQVYNFNGAGIPINSTEYQINPQTGALTTNPVYRQPDTGGFWNWMSDNGWMIPLALAGGAVAAGAGAGVGAAEAAGAGAAEAGGAGALETTGAGGLAGGGAFTPAAGSGASFALTPGAAYTAGAGAGGLSSALMGPTYGELGYTGLEAGQMGPTYAELGYTGLNNAEAIAAADAAAAAAAASQVPSWLSDLAKLFPSGSQSGLANLLRQGAGSGLASSLGNFAKAKAAGTGYGMEIPGIVKTNQNPFFNTPQAPIQNKEKTEMSQIADLLRQG